MNVCSDEENGTIVLYPCIKITDSMFYQSKTNEIKK